MTAPTLRAEPAPPAPATEACDYCGSPQLAWRKCKQVCEACGQINRSCADLMDGMG